MITQKRLKELLHYDKATGVFTWRVSRGTAKAGSIAGHKHFTGYRNIKVDKKTYKEHRLAFVYVDDYMPEEVDHKNHVRDDNSFTNLRDATSSENAKNKKLDIRNKSGKTGVYFHKRDKKWMANITHNYKTIHLGIFNTKEDATVARIEAESTYKFHENHGKDVA